MNFQPEQGQLEASETLLELSSLDEYSDFYDEE